MRDFALAAVLYPYLTGVVDRTTWIDRVTTGNCPFSPQSITTRSCQHPGVFAWVLALNFELYVEHPIFPTLPWYRPHHATAGVKAGSGDYVGSTGPEWVIESRKRPLEIVTLVRPEESR